MKNLKYALFLFLITVTYLNVNAQSSAGVSCRLWYTQPAENWMMQALPIGNGKLGAMVFGGVETEHIQFNEKSLWSGRVNSDETQNKELMAVMPTIQQLLVNGEVAKVDSLQKKYSLPREDFGAYQPFGDVFIHFKGQDNKPATGYQRDLDLSKAVASVSYQINGTTYTRTYFCSFPDQVLVCRFTADQPGSINIDVEGKMPGHPEGTVQLSGANKLVFEGAMPRSGLRYCANLEVLNNGGKVHAENNKITVDGADAVTLLMAANTNYQMQWPNVLSNTNSAERCKKEIKKAARFSYSKLLERHLVDYSPLFNRMSLDLPEAASRENLPTDQRVKKYTESNKKGESNGGDPGLEALLFHYGRYLMLSSSRGDVLPANLQGVWNNSTQPAWDSDYHTDINLEMNYWPAGITNLGECFAPFANYVDFLRVPGRITARNYFGARGFFVNIYTNPWGYAGPRWLWPGATGWLCQNLYDQFEFTGDFDYLKKKAYPIMKEACQYYLDLLYPYKGDGPLVVSPGISPEINFVTDDGKNYRLSAGAAIDQQVVYDLFTNTIEAANVLKRDRDLSDTLSMTLEKLSSPVKIGHDGAVQEWIEDWPAQDLEHRHISHLYALYPGRMIDPGTTPKWAAAADKALVKRGTNHVGWGSAWRIACYARLDMAEKAYDFFKSLIKHCEDTHIVYRGGGGTYDNLLTCHSPFQIDSNFGFTAAVAEMLLQSHLGSWNQGYELDLLPALPQAWDKGSVKGIKARGDVEVDLIWENHTLQSIVLRGHSDQRFKLRYGNRSKTIELKKGQQLVFDGKLREIK